jgi:hypothetical protein
MRDKCMFAHQGTRRRLDCLVRFGVISNGNNIKTAVLELLPVVPHSIQPYRTHFYVSIQIFV